MAVRWPIGEYLARTKWSRRMVRLLKRQNQNGKAEGELPRGVTQIMHDRAAKLGASKPSTWPYDFVRVRGF